MTRAMHALSPSVLRRTVEIALEEDLGRGDLTTEACVDTETRSIAHVVAREPLTLCGTPIVEEVFRQIDGEVRVSALVADGGGAEKGTSVIELTGRARSLLMGERVALNYLQRLSATATLTRRYVNALPAGSTTRVTDTRKTTPGMRAFERYAVRCGGGHNHREDLGSAVLIKDNHIAAAGSVKLAIARAKDRSPHTARVTCEVDTLEQLAEALDAGADVVMLDNFSEEHLKTGVGMAKGRALIEASGGITGDRIHALGQAGVDIISVGALTHSAGSVDLGLDWRGNER